MGTTGRSHAVASHCGDWSPILCKGKGVWKCIIGFMYTLSCEQKKVEVEIEYKVSSVRELAPIPYAKVIQAFLK